MRLASQSTPRVEIRSHSAVLHYCEKQHFTYICWCLSPQRVLSHWQLLEQKILTVWTARPAGTEQRTRSTGLMVWGVNGRVIEIIGNVSGSLLSLSVHGAITKYDTLDNLSATDIYFQWFRRLKSQICVTSGRMRALSLVHSQYLISSFLIWCYQGICTCARKKRKKSITRRIFFFKYLFGYIRT